jgi:histidinol dehydrogenase
VKTITTRNRSALDRALNRNREADRTLQRRVSAIVDRVRQKGDEAVLGYARRFDGVGPPLEVSRSEMRAAAREVPADVRQALHRAAGTIAVVAARQLPKRWTMRSAPGVSIEQRVEPLSRVGCYVPAGRFPLPSSLLMTAIPAKVAGVREIIVTCPRPDPAIMAAALEAGVTRLFRVGGAHAVSAMAYGTETIPRVDKIVGPGNRWVAAAKAIVSPDCSIDFFAGPTEIVVVAGSGRAEWIAADLVAQAEHDPDARSVFITWSRTLATRVARAVDSQSAGRATARASLKARGLVIVTRDAAEAVQLANRIAPEHLVVDRESLARQQLTAGAVFVGPFTAQAAGDYATGSNHVLPTAGAARFRGGLSAADFVRVMAVQRITQQGLARLAPTILPLARDEALRLHQNENTGGCSPRVLEALSALNRDQVAFYPPYQSAIDVSAAHFGVPADHLVLTNGLDEGILAVAIDRLRSSAGGLVPEAVIPDPAFEIFSFDADVVGARVIHVMPRPDFSFALDEVLAAITPRTRVVFITNPNNPTGVAVQKAAIERVARQLPEEALVFLDETYAEFADDTFIPDLGDFPNVVVGRSFSKAYGLAGLRAGALVGDPGLIARLRRAVPVFSVNAAAVVALQAALADQDHIRDYLRQVKESKALMYAACDRLGLEYWPSAANFVLFRTAGRAADLVAAMSARGIHLKDRSSEPGCAGCVRVTTGIVEHTRRCIAALEEVLCVAH